MSHESTEQIVVPKQLLHSYEIACRNCGSGYEFNVVRGPWECPHCEAAHCPACGNYIAPFLEPSPVPHSCRECGYGAEAEEAPDVPAGHLFTTFEQAAKIGACNGSVRIMASRLGGVERYGRSTPITYEKIYEELGWDDLTWILECNWDNPSSKRAARLLAFDCAMRVADLAPVDQRVKDALEFADRFAHDPELEKGGGHDRAMQRLSYEIEEVGAAYEHRADYHAVHAIEAATLGAVSIAANRAVIARGKHEHGASFTTAVSATTERDWQKRRALEYVRGER